MWFYITPLHLQRAPEKKEKIGSKKEEVSKTHAEEADLVVKPGIHEHEAKTNTSAMNIQCTLSNTVPLSQLFVLQLVSEFEDCRFTSTCTCKSLLLHIAQHWVTKPHKNVKMNIFT